MYDYHCQVLRVLDGDTVELNIDLGFNCWYKSTARLKGINAPELTGATHPSGVVSRAALIGLLQFPASGPMTIVAVTELIREKDKYGRCLVTLLRDTVNINQAMLHGGFAVLMT